MCEIYIFLFLKIYEKSKTRTNDSNRDNEYLLMNITHELKEKRELYSVTPKCLRPVAQPECIFWEGTRKSARGEVRFGMDTVCSYE